MRVEIVDRRDFLVGAAAVAAIAGLLTGPSAAQDRPPGLDEALKKIMGEAKPADGKINLELPEIAENGNTVPFTLSVDSPDDRHELCEIDAHLCERQPPAGCRIIQFHAAIGKSRRLQPDAVGQDPGRGRRSPN